MIKRIRIALLLCMVLALIAGGFFTEILARNQMNLNVRTQLRPVNWPANQLLWFAAGPYWIDEFEQGLQSGTLDQTANLKIWNTNNSIDFMKGFIRFERSGGVKEGVLANDVSLCVVNTTSSKMTLNFKGGERVEFGYDGCVMKGTLAQETSLKTYDGKTNNYPKGTIVDFNGAGQVSRAVLPPGSTTGVDGVYFGTCAIVGIGSFDVLFTARGGTFEGLTELKCLSIRYKGNYDANGVIKNGILTGWVDDWDTIKKKNIRWTLRGPITGTLMTANVSVTTSDGAVTRTGSWGTVLVNKVQAPAALTGTIISCIPSASTSNPSCQGDDDCPEGYVCQNGKCVLKKGDSKCQGDDDCPEGYVCQNGKCVFKKVEPECQGDDDCTTKGYVCQNGKCVFKKTDPKCMGDDECPQGYVCQNGKCVFKKTDPKCMGDDECPQGYVCQNGKCVFKKTDPKCMGDDECPQGYVCQKGKCVFKKTTSECDCPKGYACQNGKCVSPFDSNYSGFTNQLTAKDSKRGQDIVDQTISNQVSDVKGGKFTSAGVDEEIKKTSDSLTRGCYDNSSCPAGYQCIQGKCVKKGTPTTIPPTTTTQTPATKTGIEIKEVGTAPPGKCLIVDGQLVPVENWPVKIAGMTLTLTGPVNESVKSSGSGTFSFKEIPAGDYVIAVTEWDYGMTKQSFTAPSGKAIKITLKGSCPYLYVWTGEKFEKENDIYSVARIFPSDLMTSQGKALASQNGLFLQQLSVNNIPNQLIRQKSYRDYYRIRRHLQTDETGNYALKIKEQAAERSFSDLMELWSVDHIPAVRTGISRNGSLFFYTELVPLDVSMTAGGSVLYNDKALEIKLPHEAFSAGALAIDWQGFQDGNGQGQTADSGKTPRISLQRKDPQGVWQTVDWIYPRDELDQSFFILDELGNGWDDGDMVRLVSTSCHSEKYHRIDRVAWARRLQENPLADLLALISAVTSDGEDVRQQLLEADGKSVFLGPEDEVIMKFKAKPLKEGLERTFFFVSDGVYIPMPMLRLTAAEKSNE